MRRHALRQLCSLAYSYLSPAASTRSIQRTVTSLSAVQCRQWIAVSERINRERMRWFSTEAEKEKGKEEEKEETTSSEGQTLPEEKVLEPELAEEEETPMSSKEDISKLYQAFLKEKDAALEELTLQLEEEQKKVLLGLAEAENLRSRFARESSQAKKFAIQGFVQSLLGPLDNLDRAAESLPEELRGAEDASTVDSEKILKALNDVIVGIQLTQKDFRNVLQTNGITRYDPLGEAFDPNEHMAQFEIDDPSKEPHTIGIVNLCGYKMHERVIRPAEVGVVRKRQEETREEETESGS